jgi:hypothetical protein
MEPAAREQTRGRGGRPGAGGATGVVAADG